MESLPFIAWCLENLNQYWVIILLMAIESSFIPFPSEIVIIPAAYLSAATTAAIAAGTMATLTASGAPTSELNIIMIVVFGSMGALIGALINYGLSIWIGRPLVYAFANSRFGHMCLIDKAKVEKAEAYFEEHGAMGTFFGRLIPAVRQLISIPAGLSRMNLPKFCLYTTLGATIWNSILAFIGYSLAAVVDYQHLNEKIAEYSTPLKWSMIGLGVVIVLYLVWQGMKKK